MCPDVGALSHLVASALDTTTGVRLPPVEGAAMATDEGTVYVSFAGLSPTVTSLNPVSQSWSQFYLQLLKVPKQNTCLTSRWPAGQLKRKLTLTRPMGKKI